VAVLLVTLPTEAVTFTFPVVVMPETLVTVPADTVARLVSLEVHVATEVTGCEPLQVAAFAAMERVGTLAVKVPLVGVSVIEVMQPTVTVTVCVPLIDVFVLEVAVTVAVPTLAEVTRPLEETVATDAGVIVQATEGWLAVLPSLFVPVTRICTVLFVEPVSIVGDAGPTEIEFSVGLTKKPVQATPRTRTANTAKALARRNLCFVDVMIVTPWTRLLRLPVNRCHITA
jgi:hypothetical protein